jgi:(R,R)-butanediol dehydrogenase/meso-butanediol dehydrogenase/diacetyl reductase
MKAAVFRAPGEPLAIADVPDPTPGPGQLVLRVAGCGICGSDLHMS